MLDKSKSDKRSMDKWLDWGLRHAVECLESAEDKSQAWQRFVSAYPTSDDSQRSKGLFTLGSMEDATNNYPSFASIPQPLFAPRSGGAQCLQSSVVRLSCGDSSTLVKPVGRGPISLFGISIPGGAEGVDDDSTCLQQVASEDEVVAQCIRHVRCGNKFILEELGAMGGLYER